MSVLVQGICCFRSLTFTTIVSFDASYIYTKVNVGKCNLDTDYINKRIALVVTGRTRVAQW
jgi:hypothetical protein